MNNSINMFEKSYPLCTKHFCSNWEKYVNIELLELDREQAV